MFYTLLAALLFYQWGNFNLTEQFVNKQETQSLTQDSALLVISTRWQCYRY